MQDFKFESLERVKEATLRIQRILENRNNMINNNAYDAKEDNILFTRMNELLLESYEDLQKLPTEVTQFAQELFREDRQARETDFKAMLDECNKLIETNNELHKKINHTNKINIILIFICSFLVGLLIVFVTILKT